MKKIIALIACLSLTIALISCSKEYSSSSEEDYETYVSEVVDADLFMPRLEILGEYESILVTRKTPNDIFISTTNSVALIVTYAPENFESAAEGAARYDFLDEKIETLTDIDARVAGYTFRVVEDTLYPMTGYPSGIVTKYPKRALMVGVNEQENKIAYLCYWDIEINEMHDLDEFILNKFVLE